jgi:hypothetical protein
MKQNTDDHQINYAFMLFIRCLFPDNSYLIHYADDGAAVLKDESLETSSHLCYQNKIGCLDMNLGDPDVLETIWMKALENCASKSLHGLLQKDGKLSSLYTTQGKSSNCVLDLFHLFCSEGILVCRSI